MKKPAMKPEDESRAPLEKAQVQPAPIFGSIPSLTSGGFDDIFSLKRANPVSDSDEEDFRFVKRQRREERDDEDDYAVPQKLFFTGAIGSWKMKSKGFCSLFHEM
jgi:hypothetical protein